MVLLFTLVVYSVKLVHFFTDGVVDTSVFVILEVFSTLHNYVELHVVGWIETAASDILVGNTTDAVHGLSSHSQLHNIIAALAYWNATFTGITTFRHVSPWSLDTSVATFTSARELTDQLKVLTTLFNSIFTQESIEALKSSIRMSHHISCSIAVTISICNLFLTAKVYEKVCSNEFARPGQI
jgi:hypothetical protein